MYREYHIISYEWGGSQELIWTYCVINNHQSVDVFLRHDNIVWETVLFVLIEVAM